MESSLVSKNSKPLTPLKGREKSQSTIQEMRKLSENVNPNVSHSSHSVVKPSNSPLITKSGKSQKSALRITNHSNSPLITKSGKSQKSALRITNHAVFSPRNKIRERKFVVVAKKNLKKEKDGGSGSVSVSSVAACRCTDRFGAGNVKKCLCVAYENLRASQEDFFNKRDDFCEEYGDLKKVNFEGEGENDEDLIEGDSPEQKGSSTSKRRRAKLLEEARNSEPENGKVMHLVKAFEKLLSIPNAKESEGKEEEQKECEKVDVKKKPLKWALPGLQELPPPPKAPETRESCSFCLSDLILTAENLGLDSHASVSSSRDSSGGSISSRTSDGGRRSSRNGYESCRTMGSRRWNKKQLKVTSQKPFKLKTEQRGRQKEDEFVKKIQEMVHEEEKLRIPIAQGIPWTTDEPECLIKPAVKESTRPVELKLHSDIRAVERAEFDHQVDEKLTLIEQYKLERDRQRKLQEEEEVRRLRKELVPKAHPMPYFDRPFIPRRSEKHPTIPRELKLHIPPQQKKIKCCQSWNDITYQG